MYFEKEITCPFCHKDKTESVPLMYQRLKSNDAGIKLLAEGSVSSEISRLPPHKKAKLIEHLTPPSEPKTKLPAGAISIMALVVSWLSTGSLISSRIGPKIYFWLSVVIVCAVTVPFYSILNLVIEDFRRGLYRYKKIKAAWEKQFFCHHCQRVFIPKE